MSISDSTVKGKLNEAAGSIKQSIGEAVGNEKLANQGAADKMKGHAQEAWGSVKEGAADLKTQHEAEASAEKHDAREKMTSTSANVRDKIERGVDRLTGRKAS